MKMTSEKPYQKGLCHGPAVPEEIPPFTTNILPDLGTERVKDSLTPHTSGTGRAFAETIRGEEIPCAITKVLPPLPCLSGADCLGCERNIKYTKNACPVQSTTVD